MLCQVCNCKEATVHFTEVVSNQLSELHLCEECAQKKGLHIQPKFSIADLLTGLINLGISPPQIDETSLKCDNCSLTYSQFAKRGRLGCGRCYQTFEKSLVPLLRKIHGSIQHRGKFPHKGGKKFDKETSQLGELERLKADLEMAVESEEFEKAAKLRDKIRTLEKKGQNG